ncbi:MAG: glutathione transferase GstA [Rhodocyclales bacterium RIFCSPLOWO2_02_FULL_63_24]|nr:MAG: glutathione transferase GstA [Rhodocyclales bacterium RIFCSPLOWO2_02_FULL_63_24]
MKLYYSPGACSLSPHIALAEAGLAYSLEKVDLKTKKTETGADFFAVNPSGYVPALVLDNGEILTEGPAIVQYIADLAPDAKLAPPAGSFERVRLQELLNFISTELHKSFSPLFNPAAPEEWKTFTRGLIGRRLDVIEKKLAGRDYLMGEFSVADGYLFTILGWGRMVGVDIMARPLLADYVARVKALAGVQRAMTEEGLIK